MLEMDMQVVLFVSGFTWTSFLSMYTVPHSQGMDAAYIWWFYGQSLMGQRKLGTFLGRKSTVLMIYLDSTLPMWLKLVPTKGKKSPWSWILFTWLCVHLQWMKSLENIPVAIAIVTEDVVEKFQTLMKIVWVADDFGPVCQGGQHRLLVYQIVMRPCIQIRDWCVWDYCLLSLCTSISRKGRWPSVSDSTVNWMLWWRRKSLVFPVHLAILHTCHQHIRNTREGCEFSCWVNLLQRSPWRS